MFQYTKTQDVEPISCTSELTVSQIAITFQILFETIWMHKDILKQVSLTKKVFIMYHFQSHKTGSLPYLS